MTLMQTKFINVSTRLKAGEWHDVA